MTCPDLTQFRITDPDVGAMLVAPDAPAAVELAHRRLQESADALRGGACLGDGAGVRQQIARRLCDLASAMLSASQIREALEAVQEAINLAPDSRTVFHNFVSALYTSRELRDRNYQIVQRFICDRIADQPWLGEYLPLLYLPTFINVEFVRGKCNMKCRMCVGVNSPNHPNRLSYMEADDVAAVLDISPTIHGVTLSAGDSEPLLHPQIDEIVRIAAGKKVYLNIYTNGLMLGERTCRIIIDAQSVSAMNFSIDAATDETYKRIRGRDLARVHRNIRMLQEMKRRMGQLWPHVSMSFVAMKDNISELPAFVEQAVEFGALRVFVEDLIGWGEADGGNFPATDHERCFEYVHEAKRRAEKASLLLQLPERLLSERDSTSFVSETGAEADEPPAQCDDDCIADVVGAGDIGETPDAEDVGGVRLECCGWLNGVWVRKDGRFDPCCLVHNVADMGCAGDGPLYLNVKYCRVKELLARGKVFPACRGQRMCQYVQQQEAAGVPLRIITRQELGDLHPDAAASPAALAHTES